MLGHLGALCTVPNRSGTRRPTELLAALDPNDYLFAPESGIYERLVDLGQTVTAGQSAGRLHFLERPDREPVPVPARTAGHLLAARAPARTRQGDCVACIAQPVDRASL